MTVEHVSTETLVRVAGMVTVIKGYTPGHCCLVPEGCEEINPSIDAFSHGEMASVARELLTLRQFAESMAEAWELGEELDGAVFSYREKYPKRIVK